MISERENFVWVRHSNFCCGECAATEETAYAEDAELAAKSTTHWPYRRRRNPTLADQLVATPTFRPEKIDLMQCDPETRAAARARSVAYYGEPKPQSSYPLSNYVKKFLRDPFETVSTPPLRPLTGAERKAAPIFGGVLGYFPDAMAAVARVSKAGNDKHNPGEPLHWARGKSMDQEDCLIRHMLTPSAIDSDSGETHGAHAAWRALAALQLAEEKRLVGAGIMPLSGVTNG